MNNLTGIERQVLCRKYISKYNLSYQEAAQKVEEIVIFLSNLKTKLSKNKRLIPKRMMEKFDEEKEKIWQELDI